MVEYHFDSERNLLEVTVSGIVTDADLTNEMPDVPPGCIELFDMRRVEAIEVPSAEVRRLAEQDATGPHRVARMAVVADSLVGYGLARMYQTLSDGTPTEVRIFRDLEAARSWLGL